MAGERYEISITLSDTFSSTEAILVVITLDNDKAAAEREQALMNIFAGVEIEEEEVVEVFIEEEETINEFIQKNLAVFRGGPNPTDAQFASLSAKLDKSVYPITYIKSISTDGIVDIYISQEILIPSAKDLPSFIRHITYLFAIELTIESEGMTILGKPAISDKYTEKPEEIRTLQDDPVDNFYSGFEQLDSWNKNTTHRFKDQSIPYDETEEFLITSRTFNWTIEGV